MVVTAVLHKQETEVLLRGSKMKTMTVFEARNHFARTIKRKNKGE